MAETPTAYKHYYVPASSHWPIIASIGLGSFMIGFANILHQRALGHYFFLFGAVCIAYMMFGWFRDVIRESRHGLYSTQMDHSFRWAMAWFIFSEVMFFAGFFGALFYARNLSIPWLGGEGAISKLGTHQFLWPTFSAQWPLLHNPNPNLFPNPIHDMPPLWLPLCNTFALLTSSITITIAHHSLIENRRKLLAFMMFATIVLAITFLCLQAYEYHEAYTEFKMRLDSGMYGTTFFMLTGFHGAHVTIGTIMLITILGRCLAGHFNPQRHFGFQAVAWYWHFVDVVWLCLFIYVYVLPLR